MNHSFDKDIAVAYGLTEAIILNHMQFWIEQNEANKLNYHDGSYWTYSTTKAYAEIFPYLSQRQIQCALKHLRDEGILKTGNYNKSAYDRTLWYAFTEKGISIMQKCKMEHTEMSNGFDAQVQPIPIINTDNNSDNNSNNKTTTKKGFDAVVEEYTTNADLKEAIFDFIKFRKAIKAPLTDRALTLCLNKLDKLANNDLEKIAVLNQSIERGWRGLFEVKDNSFNASASKSNTTVPTEDDYDFERGSFWK